MSKLFGNTGGLKSNHTRRLEKLYRRRVPPQSLITRELGSDLCRLSSEIRRQIGLLIDRMGKIAYVIVGDPQGIIIPDTSDYRVAPGRLKGLRCVHTHLKAEPLSQDDLTDLALLKLDMMAALTMTADGRLKQIHFGHILPGKRGGDPYLVPPPLLPNQLDMGCLDLIDSLEDELAHVKALYDADTSKERALLFSVTTAPKRPALDSLAELKELAQSTGIEVVGTQLQQRKTTDPKFLMGRGKLKDLTLLSLQTGATLVIFDQELNASQIRSITDQIELKVIDRTQLILDIFAQRAQTREGKLQVELAQLKYLLPRLVTKNTAMSRLTGGIGGRGPGETKLEINRRRVRDRIGQLEKALVQVRKQRKQQRARRNKNQLPVISIVGYTNAGKSTLLNTLTHSRVRSESRMFATLDPSSRRLKFPRDVEVIITDTVGFIRDLPQDLVVAFRATLEELESADLLLHVVDISNPRYKEQIASVERILGELNLDRLPVLRVLNKMDRVERAAVASMVRALNGTAISALDSRTLAPLVEKMETFIGRL